MWVWLYFIFNSTGAYHTYWSYTGIHTSLVAMQLVLASPFNDPRSQQDPLHVPVADWWVNAGWFLLIIPSPTSSWASTSCFLAWVLSGCELILSWASRAEKLSLGAPLIRGGLDTLLCCCCFLQIALGYFLHSSFPINNILLGLASWSLVALLDYLAKG